MRARGRLLAVTLVLCVAAGIPAHAAEEPEPAVVARDGTVELMASDVDGQLCLALRDTGSELASNGCDDPLPGVATPAARRSDGTAYVGAAVPAAAVSADVRRIGRVVGRATTVAGEAYTGTAAGSVRFALLRLDPKVRESGLRVHATDAAGVLAAVVDSGGTRLIERRRLLSGTTGRVRWSLHEERESALASTVADLAREEVSRCVRIGVRVRERDGSLGGGSGTAACTTGAPLDELVLDSDLLQALEEDRCAPDFRLMHGVVGRSVRRVTVLLGDGRRRVAATAALRDGRRRAWALPVASGAAVRSVTLTRAGAADRRLPKGLAPVAVGCAVADGRSAWTSYVFGIGGELPPVTPAGPVTTLAGPPVVRIADGPQDMLCLALGDAPFALFGCEIVASSLRTLLGVADDAVDPRAIAFAVPANVAMVRLSSRDGKRALSIPAVAPDGYAGRYAGRIRIAAATVSRYYDLPRRDLLDDAGRLLLRTDEPRAKPEDVETHASPARRIAGRIGAPSLWEARLRIGTTAYGCLTLTAGPRPPRDAACDTYRDNETVLLDSSCVTHRLTVAVAVRPGTRVVADVGAAAPRRLALRDGAGLLTLAPGSPLRSLTFVRKGSARRVAFAAPPGARQCGWRAAPDITRR
jgi:hypothetical protein